MDGLTKTESRVLRMIRRDPQIHRDRNRPHLLILQHSGLKAVRTGEYMIRRLQGRRLIVDGDNMLTLELTQAGFAALDGSRLEGKPQLPAGLLGSARTRAMAKLLDLRREGFADPVDALLAIAYETEEDGEKWLHPIELRIQCLIAAAPYLRPKLQAILVKKDTDTTHEEWLSELRDEIDGPGGGLIEGHAETMEDDDNPQPVRH